MRKRDTKIVLFLTIILLLMAGTLWVNRSYFGGLVSGLFKESVEFDPNKESCLQCHVNTKGYSEYHNPELIGCAACHLGNTKVFEKEASHEGMIKIPGNLSDAEDTCGKCHVNELHKIKNSLMTSNSGLIAVDKYIFGEATHPNGKYHIDSIEYTAADKHIRDLCANCHLGAQKKEFGAIDELSRGGGCNACHLNYSGEALSDLNNYLHSDKKILPKFHPSTTIQITDTHCFGCHSRSSRISTNYEGWQETLLDEPENDGGKYRTLKDKRVYVYRGEDVHHSKGLLCIDCHSSHEVMGTGENYIHGSDAVKIQCSDCHFKETPRTMPYDSLDKESLLVFLHRDYAHSDKPILIAEEDGHPLVNTFLDSLGAAWLIGKKDDLLYPLNKQPSICAADHVHSAVSCATCHASWSSRCIGCHNEYNPNEPRAFDLLAREYGTGQWQESVAEFLSAPPAMGVRFTEKEYQIEPAIPGMILTIDKGSFKGEAIGDDVDFHRLYAPNSPHTITSKARSCESCHSDPMAIGYGKGTLTYNMDGARGIWEFSPDYELNVNDGLPEDAWIPFLKTYSVDITSTRSDFRPLNVKEQQTVLMVGACLTCHDPKTDVIDDLLKLGMDKVMQKISKNCILPSWKYN